MSQKYNYTFYILLSILILYGYCQRYEPDVMKAAACIQFLKKVDIGTQMNQQQMASFMVTCFINIDDSIQQKLLGDPDSLTGTEKEKLLDVKGMQGRYSQNEISEFSQRLNSAIEKIKDINAENASAAKKKAEEKKNEENNEGGNNLFGIFFSNLFEFFNPNSSLFLIVILIAITYFFLKMVKKLCNKTDANIDTSKYINKTKNKKKKN